jgi:hypothetical protein
MRGFATVPALMEIGASPDPALLRRLAALDLRLPSRSAEISTESRSTTERCDNAPMNAPQPTSPRSRLQELLAIPESRRTDAEWDEMHELEIKLSSANRGQSPDQGARRDTPATTGHPRPPGGGSGKKPFHKGHHKRGPR